MAGRKKNKRTHPAHAPEWVTMFILTLSSTGNVAAACRAANVPRRTAYDHKAAYPEFSDVWDDALEEAVDKIEGVLWKIAAKNENVRALELVLRAYRPRYREKPPEVTVNNNHLTIEGQDPLDLLKSRMADMRERMIEGGVEVYQAEVLEPSNAADKE